MRGADDHPVALLEAATSAEDDHRPGGPVAIARAAVGALGAIGLEVLALAADDTLGLDLVRPRILFGLPGEPLALVVGKGLACQHQRQLRCLIQGG
jgi:hypothetical protein